MTTAIIGESAASWVYLTLFALFFLVCVRLGGNMKFVASLARDLTGVRDRESMFDETVRETSVIFFLLLLSGCSMGVLLLGGVRIFGDTAPDVLAVYRLPSIVSGDIPSAFTCMAIACCYIVVMWISYIVVGHVFSDTQHTWAWVRGFTAGTSLGAMMFFPLALLSIAYPEYSPETIIASLLMLILLKILFVVKEFRIFFAESSSWVVFLYYLCSLEVVPLAITFGVAKALID